MLTKEFIAFTYELLKFDVLVTQSFNDLLEANRNNTITMEFLHDLRRRVCKNFVIRISKNHVLFIIDQLISINSSS
jgi:hypothetical protein